jgi:hypothetical protein
MGDEDEQRLFERLGAAAEDAIVAKIARFGGLLTRRAAVRLLCRENGIDLQKKIPLSKAPSSSLPFSFSARIERVFPLQRFPGGDKSLRLHISDGQGQSTVVLWNEQADAAQGILCGDEIECRGAYFRSGEIAVGKGGSVLRASHFCPPPVSAAKEGACTVVGTVKGEAQEREYTDRQSGDGRRMASFFLCDSQGCLRAVAWEIPEQGLPHEGDEVVLENAVFKAGELHLNSLSRIVTTGSSAQSGVLERVEAEAGRLVFAISGKAFFAPQKEGLALAGIPSLPDGVSAETALWIRARALLGKTVRYAESGGKLRHLSFDA